MFLHYLTLHKNKHGIDELKKTLTDTRDVRILRAQKFAQNRPPCAEFMVLSRIEENLPNGTESAKILLIFLNPFTYNS